MKIKKILIAIDDSPYAEHAAKYGFDIARTYEAKVGLVHIVEPMVIPATDSSSTLLNMPMQGFADNDIELLSIQSDASETLIEKTIKKFGKGMEVKHFNEFGNTASGIIDCSIEFKADLIVIGTHSRTGFDRLLMGSIDEEVVRHSPIPVLVVPFPEHKE